MFWLRFVSPKRSMRFQILRPATLSGVDASTSPWQTEEATMAEIKRTRRRCRRPGATDFIWAMPSARALLVASLLTEPPYGCLGPSGDDRYRKRSLRSQTVGASQVNSQAAAALSQ